MREISKVRVRLEVAAESLKTPQPQSESLGPSYKMG